MTDTLKPTEPVATQFDRIERAVVKAINAVVCTIPERMEAIESLVLRLRDEYRELSAQFSKDDAEFFDE